MFGKYYEKIKSFMKENFQILLFYLVFIVLFTYPLPYYISTGGGVIDTTDRVRVEGEYSSFGKLNFLYVLQLKATIPTYILANIIPTWDIESISDYQINEDESMEELEIRDKLYLEEANTSAIFVAYKSAGKEIKIHKKKNHITYLKDKSKTDLKIGDILLSVEGIEVDDIEEVRNIVTNKEVGDKLNIKVLRDDKEITCQAEVFLENSEKYIGISFLTTYDYDLEPNLELKFKNNESGPSGGLMLALTIYDKLTSEDITKGLKIAGTGTIDINGNIGQIGGVKYKLRGAVKNKMDLMIVANGENYEECMRIKNEENLDIEIIGVSTFLDAINYLKQG